jgi:predicted SAM-dependent methyltransferase
MQLHIGGTEAKEDWKILNVQDGPHVDFLGDCLDLSQFGDGSVERIYASHVFEHLSYKDELPSVLSQCRRILRAGGQLMVSVPNLGVLCQLFVQDVTTTEQRYQLMRIMFGGQTDPFDFHKAGYIEDFMDKFMKEAGFTVTERVEEFGLFDDASAMRLGPHLISLNMIATK